MYQWFAITEIVYTPLSVVCIPLSELIMLMPEWYIYLASGTRSRKKIKTNDDRQLMHKFDLFSKRVPKACDQDKDPSTEQDDRLYARGSWFQCFHSTCLLKVGEKAMIRNRYNRIPHPASEHKH